MSTLKMTRQEKAQWQRLYALADRLDHLSPWEWMSVADCFGLLFHGVSEPCFVVFGGQPKAFRHVRFLLGWKAFYDLVTRLAEPAKQTATWLLEIPMIELLFIADDLLFDHECALLAALDRAGEREGLTPIFRSILPGYHPWLPDKDERTILDAALYQAFGMAMRVESDGMLLKSRFPREVLMRTQDERGEWHDAWSAVKEMADEEIEVRIAAKPLQTLTSKPLWPLTVQLDLVFTPLTIGPEGHRPQTAYVLLAVDAVSGMIIAEDLLHAAEGIPQMWAKIPERLLEIFARLGGCPEAIEICSDRMANLLRPLGEFIPFRMIRRERLAMLEKARGKLSDYMKNLDSKS
jgi:hypothetical protein